VPDPEKGDLIRLTTAAGTWERPAYDCEPLEAYQRSYVAAQSHFVECLSSGRTPETVGEDNLNTLATTLAAYHSAELGQVVDVQGWISDNLRGESVWQRLTLFLDQV
jgi:predicted dehydrogenase